MHITTCNTTMRESLDADLANIHEGEPTKTEWSTPQCPPIAPTPEWVWREERMWHLIERLAGYANQTDHPAQEAWLSELRSRIDEVLMNSKARSNPK